MEKRIELEKRGVPTEEVKELNLDNCRASQIEGLTEDFKSLESVSLINVGLVSLKGFPKLPSLKKLELSDNRISGTLNLLQGCTNLMYLNLSGNKIKDIEALEPLTKLKSLKNLDLFNNEVTTIENYREKVFKLLENLQYLDGFNSKDEEAEEDIFDGDDSDDGEDDEDDDDDEEGEDDDDDDDDDVVDVDEDDDDDDENEVDEEDDDDDEEDDEQGQVGLDYLTKDGIEDDSEGEDYQQPDGKEDEEEEEDDEEAGEVDGESRGVKRKLEEEGDDS